MDASTTGAKGSTSKHEPAPAAGPHAPPRRDKQAGARRARVMQVLLMQGGLIVILLALALLSRGDARSTALYFATLLVPIGWGYAIYTAFLRDEAARREGRWSKEWDAAQRKRTLGMLGALVLVWVVLATAIVLLL